MTAIDTILSQQEELLKQAVAKCMSRVNTDPNSANLRDLRSAQKQLAEYQKNMQTETSGGRFTSTIEAARWIMAEGYLVKERSAQDHVKQNVARQKDGTYLQKHVEEYARRTWENPGQTQLQPEMDDKARLIKAQADKLELGNEVTRGQYLLKSEEEARDARVLAAIKQAVENFGPFIIQDLITIGKEQQHLDSAAPTLLARYSDQAADLFNRFAISGTIE